MMVGTIEVMDFVDVFVILRCDVENENGLEWTLPTFFQISGQRPEISRNVSVNKVFRPTGSSWDNEGTHFVKKRQCL